MSGPQPVPDSTTSATIALACAGLAVLGVLAAAVAGHGGPLGLTLAALIIGGIHVAFYRSDRADEDAAAARAADEDTP